MSMEIPCEWARTVDPVLEPLDLADAKKHAVIISDDDNALIDAYVIAARMAAESFLNRALLTQTWVLQLDAFADELYLPMAAPLQSVTHVKYYDTAGVQQTLSTSFYNVDTVSEPGCIRRAPNQAWPSVQADRQRPITITYVAGWTDGAKVPELIKHGCRLFVSYADADRNGSIESEASRRAAEACWQAYGPVHWKAPQVCPY